MIKKIKELLSSQIKYFVFYYNQLRYKMLVILAFSTVIAFLDGVGLTLFIPIFQVAEAGNASGESLGKLDFVIEFFNKMNIPLTISVILVFLMVLFTFKGILKMVERYFFTKIKVQYTRKLRLKLIQGLTNVSYPGFVSMDQGRLHNIIISEIQNTLAAFQNFFIAMQTSIMLMVYVALAFAANFQFAFFITLIGLLSGVIYSYLNVRVEKISMQRSQIANGIQSKLIQLISNYKFLKATNLIKPYRSKLDTLVYESEELAFKMGILNGISFAIREPLTIGIIALAIYIQVVLFQVPILSIALSLMLFYKALTNLLILQGYWQSFLTNTGSIILTNELLAELSEKKESSFKEETLKQSPTNIHIKALTYKYPESIAPVLNNINFDIQKNQTIAFVGGSGSGKTTLINILAGLLTPTGGRVEIDDVELTPNNVHHYRSNIGYITQEAVVFNDTFYNNVTFWAPKTEENLAHFWKVLEQTSLLEMMDNLPEREDSVLGDSGMKISGGQKQRISIARELYRGCNILLMDEATSALDSETEQQIQANINSLKGKYTIIIIAHRLSTVKTADVIYLLDKGVVAAQGPFDQLVQISPQFKHMVELQEF
jgi:ABC-type multidrug transport system fused ATPase/permease subunit